MKRYIVVLLLGITIPCMIIARDSDDTEDTGRSYLGIRPMAQLASPEILSQWRYSQLKQKEDTCTERMFQAVFFASKTTNAADLASYFSPFGVRRLRVSEDTNTAMVGDFELLSSFFGVITGAPTENPFLSVISLCPTHSEIGIDFGYRQELWQNEDETAGLYFYVTAPIMNVRNNLHFRETILNDGGGRLTGEISTGTGTIDVSEVVDTFDSMREAFNQKGWNFGKITSNKDKMSKTGIADITAVIEYRWLELMAPHDCHIETYGGFLIPTGNKVKGHYLFEPIVGHGQHWGIVWGSNFGVKIWEIEDSCKIRAELTNHSMYLFSKTQVRSFDVKGRPWSRYIDVYLNLAQAQEAAALGGQAGTFVSTPGINVFTQAVDVTPGLSHVINSAIVFDGDCWQGEIGYNFYARASELVELCRFPDDVAFVAVRGLGFTQPLQDIAAKPDDESLVNSPDVPLSMYDRSVIKEDDLDLASAATPAILSNILYASLGIQAEYNDYPVFGNIGASYEFSDRTKAAPQRWGIWIKGGVSF
ncbi:MAG TPA: hypothetical protein VGW78_05425 [Candidatus Babeliales bacterium]|nr:hypothetical protein [Candidatus Babeliales bacterium]